MIIIYIKQNKTSGKKYIGYTTDIEKIDSYLGSGKYWVNHCKKYGGYNTSNIETIFYLKCDLIEGRSFLSDFEKKHPEYWTNKEWANLVPETLESSPFKGNMDTIFEKHGNPFAGGDIQRQAHIDGKYNTYDRSENSKKGWKKRDKQKMAENMSKCRKKWIEENPEKFREFQKQRADKSREVNCQKLEYEGKVYLGWVELEKELNISKYKLQTYYMDKIILL
jgi:hypothetical protein